MARKPKNNPAGTPTAPQLSVSYQKTNDLIPYARNARTHSQQQVTAIAASVREFGFTNPILVDSQRGVIAGHGRLMAAMLLGMDEVPTIELGHLTQAQRRAYVLADNKLAENAGWDMDLLRIELGDLLNENVDLELLGFGTEELEDLLELFPKGAGGGTGGDEKTPGALVANFGAPPFSVLDTRQGYWQDRKGEWLKIIGNPSATKEKILGGEMLHDINDGSSNFDPVLAELMMRWFCPSSGFVLDPFGGEQTKGVVAGELGLHYHGIEIRPEQVEVNRKACAAYPHVQYCCADSEQMDTCVPPVVTEDNGGYDLVFTSPPYYDLEVYSKDDMSALGTYEEFMAKYERIFTKAVALMRDGAFLVIKVGEIRDKKTNIYRNFVGDNIAMFRRLGLSYYNELVLISPAGTAPVRAARYFASRKMAKLHQNVLVFWKGDVRQIKDRFGDVTDGADLTGATDEEDDK